MSLKYVTCPHCNKRHRAVHGNPFIDHPPTGKVLKEIIPTYNKMYEEKFRSVRGMLKHAYGVHGNIKGVADALGVGRLRLGRFYRFYNIQLNGITKPSTKRNEIIKFIKEKGSDYSLEEIAFLCDTSYRYTSKVLKDNSLQHKNSRGMSKEFMRKVTEGELSPPDLYT